MGTTVFYAQYSMGLSEFASQAVARAPPVSVTAPEPPPLELHRSGP